MQLISPEDPKDFQNGYLTLPFDGEQFQSFIKGLLGTPQTITKSIWGCFEIHLKDLQNFHDLINQRITQQNKGQLLQLKTQIYYSDESSVLLSSYEELLTYNEVKPVVSEAVRMTWVYLIQFADKNVPERQEIELMIVATTKAKIRHLPSSIRIVESSIGQFNIIIKHTARTWGTDIEFLIGSQINSILIKNSKFRDFLSEKSTSIGFIAALLVLGSSLASIYYINKTSEMEELLNISKFAKSAENLSAKIDYLLKYIVQDPQGKQSTQTQIFTVASLIISVILGIWVSGLADNKKRSYLVLTREAKNNRDHSVKTEDKTFRLFWLSIIASILTGILSSYIFKWISN